MFHDQNLRDTISSSISVIVPTRNEGQTIVSLAERLHAALPRAEIWIIDGGYDDTRERLAEWQSRWPTLHYHRHVGDRGKGHAIRKGIELCTRPLIAQLDADLQFDPEDLLAMAQAFVESRADFVCGSRFLPTSSRQARSTPGLRAFGNRAFSLYTSAITGQRFSDVLAGIKMWKREVTEAFSLTSDDYSYEVELPVKARRLGFRVIDFPVTTTERTHGKSSVNVVKTSVQLLKNIPKFQWQKIS